MPRVSLCGSERVCRVPKLTSFRIVASMFFAEISERTAAICGFSLILGSVSGATAAKARAQGAKAKTAMSFLNIDLPFRVDRKVFVLEMLGDALGAFVLDFFRRRAERF